MAVEEEKIKITIHSREVNDSSSISKYISHVPLGLQMFGYVVALMLE